MKVLKTITILYIYFVLGNCVSANNADEHYQRGIEYRDAGQFQKAISSFEKVFSIVRVDEDRNLLANTHFQIASIYYILEEYHKSISSYNNAITLNPNSVLYYNALGISHSEAKQYKDAISSFRKATKLNPKNAQPYYNLGLVYLKQGELSLAKAAFNKAIIVDTNWVDAYLGLAEVLLKQGHLENAEKSYLKALEISANGINALSGLGQVYAKQKRYDLAIDTYEKVISLESDNTEANYQLAQIYNKLGDRDKAALKIAFFKLLRSTDPILEKAVKWVKTHPDDPIGFNNLGIIYLTRQRYDKAIENYNRAITLSPNLAISHYNLGLTYHKQGKLDMAINSYQKAISLNSTLAIAHNNLAVCYTDLRQNLKAALLHAETATSLAPDDANYWDTLATVCTHLGLDNQAQNARQKQISLQNSPEK